MLGAVMGCLPPEARVSAVHLEEVVEFGAVIYDVRWCQKQATVPGKRDGRSRGLVESKVSDMVRGVWL